MMSSTQQPGALVADPALGESTIAADDPAFSNSADNSTAARHQRFDPIAWVNAVFEEEPQPPFSKEEYPSARQVRLQADIKTMTAAIDKDCDALIRDIPTVMRSIDVVSQEVDSLRESMAVVRNDIERVENNTAESMSLLMQLDEAKTRMSNTQNTLKEVQEWEAVASSVRAALGSSDCHEVHQALVALHKFLHVPCAAEDQELRASMASELTARLVLLAKHPLSQAIAQHDKDAAIQYLRYLDFVNRIDAAIDLFKSNAQDLFESVTYPESATVHESMAEYLLANNAALLDEKLFFDETFGQFGAIFLPCVEAHFGVMAQRLQKALKSSLPQAPSLLPEAALSLVAATEVVIDAPILTAGVIEELMAPFSHYQTNFEHFAYLHFRHFLSELNLARMTFPELCTGKAAPNPVSGPPPLQLENSWGGDNNDSSKQDNAQRLEGKPSVGEHDDEGEKEEEEKEKEEEDSFNAAAETAFLQLLEDMVSSVADFCCACLETQNLDTLYQLTSYGAAQGFANAFCRIVEQALSPIEQKITSFTRHLQSDATRYEWAGALHILKTATLLASLVEKLAKQEETLRHNVLRYRGAQIPSDRAGIDDTTVPSHLILNGGKTALLSLAQTQNILGDYQARVATKGHPDLLLDYIRHNDDACAAAIAFTQRCHAGLPLFPAVFEQLERLQGLFVDALFGYFMLPINALLRPLSAHPLWIAETESDVILPFVSEIETHLETLSNTHLGELPAHVLAVVAASVRADAVDIDEESVDAGDADDADVNRRKNSDGGEGENSSQAGVVVSALTLKATQRVAESVYAIKHISLHGCNALCDNIGVLCNAVLEIGPIHKALETLNIALRDSPERLEERVRELEKSPLAVAAHHAQRLKLLATQQQQQQELNEE